MNFEQYQSEVLRTIDRNYLTLAVAGLGIAGEGGEVCDILKKHIGHLHPLDHKKLVEELGDLLWYIAAIAELEGLELDSIAYKNIDKLNKRYPNGFSPEASMNRKEQP